MLAAGELSGLSVRLCARSLIARSPGRLRALIPSDCLIVGTLFSPAVWCCEELGSRGYSSSRGPTAVDTVRTSGTEWDGVGLWDCGIE